MRSHRSRSGLSADLRSAFCPKLRATLSACSCPLSPSCATNGREPTPATFRWAAQATVIKTRTQIAMARRQSSQASKANQATPPRAQPLRLHSQAGNAAPATQPATFSPPCNLGRPPITPTMTSPSCRSPSSSAASPCSAWHSACRAGFPRAAPSPSSCPFASCTNSASWPSAQAFCGGSA